MTVECALVPAQAAKNSFPPVFTMTIIDSGTVAPAFGLESHLDSTVQLSDFAGQKNVLLVFYPLDFTPT